MTEFALLRSPVFYENQPRKKPTFWVSYFRGEPSEYKLEPTSVRGAGALGYIPYSCLYRESAIAYHILVELAIWQSWVSVNYEARSIDRLACPRE